MKDYLINIFYSDEDQAYVADIPDLEMCSGFGDSPEQALAEVLLAQEGILTVMHANGLPLPEPRFRPANSQIA